MNRAVLIASGGLDSTVLYFYLLKAGFEVLPVNFIYGSRHNQIERARLIENIFNPLFIDMDLSMLKSSLLQGGEAIPHGHYAEESMKSTVVPFRNGIMLSYAVGIAESNGIKNVVLGSHSGDHTIYPDCRPEFNEAFKNAAFYGTFNHVELIAPFANISKGQIAAIGKSLGIERQMMRSWSCYEGEDTHCGECGACTERKEAFAFAGLTDTTGYKK